VIAEHLAWLATWAPARMSGSGACVFAEFATLDMAATTLAQLPATMRGWLAPGLDHHPLRALAD